MVVMFCGQNKMTDSNVKFWHILSASRILSVVSDVPYMWFNKNSMYGFSQKIQGVYLRHLKQNDKIITNNYQF